MESPYSNKLREMTIQPGCPWYDAQQNLGAPNVNWCEPTICAVINEPANTWSNLGYIIVGIALMRVLLGTRLMFFGPTVIIMGLLSFTYHATNNYFTQYLDFFGMFLMMSFILTFNLQRHFTSLLRNFYATYWFMVMANMFLFISFDIFDSPIQKMMLINAIPILILDLYAGYKENTLRHYRFFWLTVLTLILAQGFAIMDITRMYCEPENTWLHGHVIWHLLGAVAMLLAGLHMRKITSEKMFT